MTDFFKENGSLSDKGEKSLRPLHKILMELFSLQIFKNLSIQELQSLGFHINKMVNNAISNIILNKNELQNKFDTMTNDQFEAYMKIKYGDHWALTTINNEEYVRTFRLAKEKISKFEEENIILRIDSEKI